MVFHVTKRGALLSSDRDVEGEGVCFVFLTLRPSEEKMEVRDDDFKDADVADEAARLGVLEFAEGEEDEGVGGVCRSRLMAAGFVGSVAAGTAADDGAVSSSSSSSTSM